MYLEQIIVRPAHPRPLPPLLLLHDAWHGAWCWEAAMPDLAARGFTVHAVSVRSHGASASAAPWATICDYTRDVRTAIAALAEPPIVVGHSAGGYVLQLLITGAVGPPPAIAGAVLLCSSRPQRNHTPMLVIAVERDAVFDLAAQRVTATAYRAPLVCIPHAAHNLMLDPAWPLAAAAIADFAASHQSLGGPGIS